MFRAFSRQSSGDVTAVAASTAIAAAVIELLMMGGRTAETCSAVKKTSG